MTKKQKMLLAELENKAWEDLVKTENIYVHNTFPSGYGYIKAQETRYQHEYDLEVKRATWNALYDYALRVDVTLNHSDKAFEYTVDTHNYLEGIGIYAVKN